MGLFIGLESSEYFNIIVYDPISDRFLGTVEYIKTNIQIYSIAIVGSNLIMGGKHGSYLVSKNTVI
jgi:hypothetical protein